eukprot:c25632_g3_i1 orf=1-423(-)
MGTGNISHCVQTSHQLPILLWPHKDVDNISKKKCPSMPSLKRFGDDIVMATHVGAAIAAAINTRTNIVRHSHDREGEGAQKASKKKRPQEHTQRETDRQTEEQARSERRAEKAPKKPEAHKKFTKPLSGEDNLPERGGCLG